MGFDFMLNARHHHSQVLEILIVTIPHVKELNQLKEKMFKLKQKIGKSDKITEMISFSVYQYVIDI